MSKQFHDYTLEEKKSYFKALFAANMDSLPLLYKQRVQNLLAIDDEVLLQKYYEIIRDNIGTIRGSIQNDVLTSIHKKEGSERVLDHKACEDLLGLLGDL